MSKQNELEVTADDMKAAAVEVVEDAAADSVIESSETGSPLEATIRDEDIPQPFWENGEVDDVAQPEAKEKTGAQAKDDVSKNDGSRTISYKANGKEVKISEAEAAKKLALVDGARKAFSEKNRLEKKSQEQATEIQKLAEYKDTWQKLEALKDDPRRLYEVISGESYDTFRKREAERWAAYQEASPEQQRAMDAEERMKSLENQIRRDREASEARLKEAETKEFATEQKHLNSKLEREFFKYQFPEDNAQQSNRLKQMLWVGTLADIKKLHKAGYEVSDALIARTFKENASALQAFYKKSVDKGVAEVTAKKKQEATEKAQLASTRNYADAPSAELTKLDPLTLFNRMKRGK